MITLDEIKQTVSPIFSMYGVQRAQLFGSYAFGNANAESDIDLVVSLKEPMSLLKFFKMNNQLEDALGKKVDLATPASLNPRLSERIKKQLVPIYER